MKPTQPKPTEEWTVEELDGYAVLNRHDVSVPMRFTYISGIKEIADAHNASLVSEGEKLNILEDSVNDFTRSNAALTTEVLQLRAQLDAEREKVQTYEDALIKIANDPNCDRCQVAVDALAKVAK